MPPPQLARDAPVGDVLHPLVVGVDPVLGHEPDLAVCDGVDRLLRDAASVWTGLGHRDEPLVGQHRLDDLPGARTTRHHQLVLLDLDQETLCLQVGDDAFAGDEAVQALVGRRRVLVDCCIQRQHADDRQAVALADGVVVHVVRRRHLDDSGAEGAINVIVGDHRDRSTAERQRDALADEGGVALILRVHHHRDVAEHRFRPRGGHHQVARAILQRIADVPQRAVFLFAFHFQV